MNKPLSWLITVILVLLWSMYELYPPTSRSLTEQFEREAENTQDPVFREVLNRARQLQAPSASSEFNNLLAAAGTNSLERFFPRIEIPPASETNRVILNQLQRDALGQIKLGLDLQGGMSFMVQMQTNELNRLEDRERALDQAVEILRKRVDRFGVAEPLIQRSGVDRIVIQMPGLTDSEKDAVKRQIEMAAYLEFRMVHPENERLIAEGLIPAGYEVLTEVERGRGPGSPSRSKPILVKKKAEDGLTGTYVTRADAVPDPMTGEPKIEFEFNGEGARIFADITRRYRPREGGPRGTEYSRLAIVLDGVLRSAPVIRGEIPGGRGVIEGNFDVKEASELANVLMNPLEAPVTIIEERSVDPSLGADSIRSGMIASIVGTVAVAAFMVFFYFFAGAVANFALTLNIIITMGVMCAIDTTLTLPGIAGLVLSIGMAVDANVLIFERIREELAAGKSLKGALKAGYSRAFGTILDSHVTTLISALVLMWRGTGPIKGFGVTLTIGVAASLFTALVVTRLVFDALLAKGWMKSLPMMPIVRLTKVNFMGWTKVAFAFSAVIILGGIGYGVFGRGERMLGVDFAGGDSLTLRFTERVGVDKLRETVARLGVGDPLIQYQRNITGAETLQIQTAYGKEGQVLEALRQEYPAAGFQSVGLEKIGPSVGREIQLSAVLSLMLATLGILVYVAFRYEFSFAIAAVVATAHDLLFTLGVFAIYGGELNSPMVAALLTIMGYSINDKIVILDRIREDLKLGVRGSFRELVNLALNQTLGRTLITGGAVILATLALFIFGGSGLHDFAFTFLVGILAGTYSSIFVACPILLWWHKGHRPVMGPPTSVAAPQVQHPSPARA